MIKNMGLFDFIDTDNESTLRQYCKNTIIIALI